MHNVESRITRPIKRPKLKLYKNHKSSFRVLKNYKVSRTNKMADLMELPEPIKLLAYDHSCMPRTVQAFLEASNRKKQSWITQTPVKKVLFEDYLSEKDQSEEDVYCDCKRPYSQGELMFKCEGFCEGWYHPECLKMKPDEVERQRVSQERWYCPSCIFQAQKIVLDTSNRSPIKKPIKNNI